jgi:hypothetical protein
MEMASFRALPMFLVDSCAPLPCTKSRRRPATLSFLRGPLRISATSALKGLLKRRGRRDTQRTAEKYDCLCKAARLRCLKP